jgi:hypothetical protein
MTTATWSSGNLHDTDANFRIWGSEFAAKLAAVGLVQTADTGQINWSTVVRAASSADAGYEIWRFNDSLQASAPIFMKIYYGTGTTILTGPRIRIEIGTGSNGTGTITGIGAGTGLLGNYHYNTAGAATSVPSYMCHTEGFFGYVWKRNAGAQGCFLLTRTCNASGVPDTYGYTAWGYGQSSGTSGNSNVLRHVRFAGTPASIYLLNGSGTSNTVFVPYGYPVPTTTPDGDRQLYICWGGYPQIRPIFSMFGYYNTEIAEAATVSVAMVGTTPRTYLATGFGADASPSTAMRIAFLWE